MKLDMNEVERVMDNARDVSAHDEDLEVRIELWNNGNETIEHLNTDIEILNRELDAVVYEFQSRIHEAQRKLYFESHLQEARERGVMRALSQSNLMLISDEIDSEYDDDYDSAFENHLSEKRRAVRRIRNTRHVVEKRVKSIDNGEYECGHYNYQNYHSGKGFFKKGKAGVRQSWYCDSEKVARNRRITEKANANHAYDFCVSNSGITKTDCLTEARDNFTIAIAKLSNAQNANNPDIQEYIDNVNDAFADYQAMRKYIIGRD